MQDQQRLQAQNDASGFSAEGVKTPPPRPQQQALLPGLRILNDRDPMVLVLSEKPDLAQRLAEALSRKYGLAHLDYIKGPVKAQLAELGEGWGRSALILIHNQLRLTSSMELCKQLLQKEQCPVPVVLLGTEETDPNHPSLPHQPEAMAQGPYRLARGEAFYARARALAAAEHVGFGWSCALVPGVGHDNGGMAPVAVRILFGDAKPVAGGDCKPLAQ